jgi:hypothetical protein
MTRGEEDAFDAATGTSALANFAQARLVQEEQTCVGN